MKSWRLTWGDKSWTEADMTGRHLVLVSLGIGSDGWDISPTAGPIRLLATLAAFVAVDSGREIADVLAELNALPASALVEALTIE
jgi:hypothetical protein